MEEKNVRKTRIRKDSFVSSSDVTTTTSFTVRIVGSVICV